MGKEYVVVETAQGEGIVAVIPDGAHVAQDVAPDLAPLPLAEAQEVADTLNGDLGEGVDG